MDLKKELYFRNLKKPYDWFKQYLDNIKLFENK